MSAPAWPPGLTPQMPLPYRLWRVMSALEGRADLAEVARQCQLTEEGVRAALTEAGRWVERATQRQQPLGDTQEQAVIAALSSVVGPMARVMIEDALGDLEDEGHIGSFDALLDRLVPELNTEQRAAFAVQLRARSLV